MTRPADAQSRRSFIFGDPQIATAAHCKAPWSGSSQNFRCYFCGHRFVIGDRWRGVFTNNKGSKAFGNPLVCESCDGTDEEVSQRWAEKHERFREMVKSGEWWWFFKLERSKWES